jgi:hypothetical protein
MVNLGESKPKCNKPVHSLLTVKENMQTHHATSLMRHEGVKNCVTFKTRNNVL